MALGEAPPLLTCTTAVRSWYAPASGKRDIAREAYEEARAFIEKELQANGKTDMLALAESTTIGEVRNLVEQAKSQYSASSQSKKTVRKWLGRFSARIMYYGQVLDVLAQHHPEYVALAWGALKFIMMGILNHGRLVSEFSQALAMIGDALRQTKLNAELFQTDDIKEALSRLYAHIILFFQHAMRWYNRSPAGRAFSAIFKPYELEYQDTLEQIKLCAETVNDIASTSSRAEIRDINVTIQSMRQEIRQRDEKIEDMRLQLRETQATQSRTEDAVNHTLQVAISNKALCERIHVNVCDMSPQIRDIRFSHILQTIKLDICPDTVLQKAQSIARRSRANKLSEADPKEVLNGLNDWLSRDGCSVFVVRVGPRAEAKAKELCTDVISFLQSKSMKVIWRISSPIRGSDRGTISTTEVYRALIFQALRTEPSLARDMRELDLASLHATHTEADWLHLLRSIFSRILKCFLIVETDDLFRANQYDKDWVSTFLQTYAHLADCAASNGNTMKILIMCYGGFNSALQSLSCRTHQVVSNLNKPAPVPACHRRKVIHRKRKDVWRRLSPKI